MALPPIRVPRIRGTQIGLKNPATVDTLKADMLAGRFDFLAPRGRIAGIRDGRLVFHVMDGHHRVVAALEIYAESGDMLPLLQLLGWGKWDDMPAGPTDNRPMPSRHWWGALRNWIGF
jgi:hypothetical protein